MIAAELSVVGGKHAGQVIPLNRRKFLIGREQDCQLRPNSEMVSRHHCVFSLDDFSVRLRDLGSTNGTFVNGTRIQKETVLRNGDHVVIGNLEFRFAILPGTATDSSGSSAGFELKAKPEDTQVTSQTVLEIPVAQPATASSETVVVPAVAPAAPAPVSPVSPEPVAAAPAAPAPAPAVAPAAQPAIGMETMVMQPGQMMPGQFGYPQQMMQPMAFPGGLYGGYPYQHLVPQYGQMYQPMMAPQMPAMPAQQPAPAAAAPGVPDVALPDPETTGAREEAAKGSTGANPKDTAKPTGAADAILKQMSGRRPTT